MQPPNLQQKMESSVWSRAPPVNRAPQPAPGKVQYNIKFKATIMINGAFTLPDTDKNGLYRTAQKPRKMKMSIGFCTHFYRHLYWS